MTAMSVGVAKEIYDSRKGGSGFDTADIKADLIGAASGAIIGRGVFVYATTKKKKTGIGLFKKF